MATRQAPDLETDCEMFAASTVYMAERLNAYLAANWQTFAKQPYFDEQGIFFSAMVSAPLLLTMFLLVVSAHELQDFEIHCEEDQSKITDNGTLCLGLHPTKFA